ncbi:MAG: diguanylate cyclase [Gallionellaceae bacterium]|nr:MAG: diguanylate cyclase [Gallionellaceae bacterium]
MKKQINPSEVARETLIILASRKLAPTPENYSKVFQEISGVPAPVAAEDPPPNTGTPKLELAWSDLIQDLLRQLETPHKGITITRKKDGLETVLNRFSAKPDELFTKLQGLLRSWSTAPTASMDIPPPPAASGAATPVPGSAPQTGGTANPAAGVIAPPGSGGKDNAQGHQELISQLRELLAQTLENSLTTQPELSTEIKELAQQVRATDNNHIYELANKLRHFWIKLELRGGDKTRIQEGLVRLLRLLVENVGELVADDQWLHGQIVTLQEIIANPIDKRVIADAERNLRDAIVKQGLLQKSLSDAKSTLKGLMTAFIDRLGDLSETTGLYHTKIEGYGQKIGGASNLADLGHILEDIMHDTRIIQDSALRSHHELVDARKQADEAEARIKQLEQELEQISEMVHEDQLTGVLNRRGMDETFAKELHRADRGKTPVCVALLDIDNFKKLNDTLGHQAGDQALIHLARVIKECLRPADTVARYGGEEFVIILPDTPLKEGVEAVERLQRELTKKFFLNNNERILVTFSAGVALRNDDEDQEDILGRADKAMYLAKKTGKNRVIAAE